MQKNNHKIFVVIYIFACILCVYSFLAEFAAAAEIKKCAFSTFSDLRSSWQQRLEMLPFPSIDSGSALTLRARLSSSPDTEPVCVTASYSPETGKIAAQFSLINSGGEEERVYAFSDSSEVGVSVDDADGTFYTIPAKKLKSDFNSGRLSSVIDMPSFVPDDISFKSLKNLLSLLSDEKNTVSPKGKSVIKSAVPLLLSTHIVRSGKISVNHSGNDIMGKKYTLRIRASDIEKFISNVWSNHALGIDALKDKFLRALQDCGDGYFNLFLTTADGKITDITIITPKFGSASYKVNIGINSHADNICADISDVTASRKLFKLRLATDGNAVYLDGVHFSSDTSVSFVSDISKSEMDIDVSAHDKSLFAIKTYKFPKDYTVHFFKNKHTAAVPVVSLSLSNADTEIAESINTVSLYKASLGELFALGKKLHEFTLRAGGNKTYR